MTVLSIKATTETTKNTAKENTSPHKENNSKVIGKTVSVMVKAV